MRSSDMVQILKGTEYEKWSVPGAERMTVLKKGLGGALPQGVGKSWRNWTPCQPKLPGCQESAASFGEDSTRVNLLKGMPAFTRPSR